MGLEDEIRDPQIWWKEAYERDLLPEENIVVLNLHQAIHMITGFTPNYKTIEAVKARWELLKKRCLDEVYRRTSPDEWRSSVTEALVKYYALNEGKLARMLPQREKRLTTHNATTSLSWELKTGPASELIYPIALSHIP